MSEKFTPGPWRVGKCSSSMAVVVADFPVPEISGSDEIEYYGGHLIAESITPANARLAAAAPDMYEALKNYISVSRCKDPVRVPLPNPQGYASNVECRPCGECMYCLACAAIAKADGTP